MAKLQYKFDSSNISTINTRFGEIDVNSSSIFCFPQGVVGIPNSHYYYLCEVPENKIPGACLVHGLDEDKISFITLPLDKKFYIGEDAIIKQEDINNAVETYNISYDDLIILVIAKITYDKESKKVDISINLKAPIFVNLKERVAFQHVFISKEYPLKYSITE